VKVLKRLKKTCCFFFKLVRPSDSSQTSQQLRVPVPQKGTPQKRKRYHAHKKCNGKRVAVDRQKKSVHFFWERCTMRKKIGTPSKK